MPTVWNAHSHSSLAVRRLIEGMLGSRPRKDDPIKRWCSCGRHKITTSAVLGRASLSMMRDGCVSTADGLSPTAD
jgi:hypothetical protein